MTMLLGACGFMAGGERVIHTHLLSLNSVPEHALTAAGKAGAAVLLVNVPRSQAGFDTPQMVYLLRPHEMNYYASNQWADTPARMLGPLLVQALEGTRSWRAVVQMPSTIRGDYRVDSESLALEQEFFQQPSRVRLTMRAQLVDLRGQVVLGTRAFEVLEDAPSEDAYGGVIAANRAVAKLLDQVASWLSSCINDTIQRGC